MTGTVENEDPTELLNIDPFVRIKFISQATGLSRATIYRYIARGRFPKQTYIGSSVSVWRLSEVRDWMERQPTSHREIGLGT